MPQSDEYRKKEKKRKKFQKKEENLKKKIKSNHLVIQCICLLTQIKAIVPSGGGPGAPPLQAVEPQREGGSHGLGGLAGLVSPYFAALGPWMRVHTVFLYTLCTVEPSYCLTGAPYLLEPRELGGPTWRASSLFKHEVGGGWEGGDAHKPRERFIKRE